MISHNWNRVAAEEMKPFGLKGAHGLYLLTLSGGEGMTASELARACGKDKADISRAVGALEKQGLIERGGNYRAALRLTERGALAAEQIRKRASAAAEFAGAGLSDAERLALYRALDKITENITKMGKEGIPE